MTYLLQRDGEHGGWVTPFDRDEEGAVVLGETIEEEGFTGRPLFSAVLRVWERWPAATVGRAG